MGIDILIGLGAKLLPYLAVIGAAIYAYFAVKGRGAAEEREKWEQAQEEAKAEVIEKIEAAQKQDVEIDEKVKKQIEEIKQDSSDTPSDIFRF